MDDNARRSQNRGRARTAGRDRRSGDRDSRGGWPHSVLCRCYHHSSARAQMSDDSTDKEDRKSTRLNSSHANISYAVFCLKKKKKKKNKSRQDMTEQSQG